ncbi:MAG: phasin family protein [Thermoanaerobaculia bacterium]|jgi:poly(hydroxyalkanoate) granule-associated protein
MSEAQTSTNPGGLGRELLSAGRNLWLAGLGAIAEAEETSVKLFDRLVERGRPLDERQRKTVDAFADRANGALREAGKLFQDTVEYESRQVLKKMGVLTRDDLKVLAARLDILARQIDEYAAAREVAQMTIITPETAAADSAPAQTRQPRQRKTITR